MRTHYDNLKVPEKASFEVIKASYRALSLKHHPDMNPGSPDSIRIMQILNDAYAVLGDASKRREYDRKLMLRRNPGPIPGFPTHGSEYVPPYHRAYTVHPQPGPRRQPQRTPRPAARPSSTMVSFISFLFQNPRTALPLVFYIIFSFWINSERSPPARIDFDYPSSSMPQVEGRPLWAKPPQIDPTFEPQATPVSINDVFSRYPILIRPEAPDPSLDSTLNATQEPNTLGLGLGGSRLDEVNRFDLKSRKAP